MEGADNRLEEWYAIVKEYPELEQVATNAKKHLSMTRMVMDEYSESLNKTVEINREWDDLIKLCLIHLETTMEEVIHPATETAERSKDIAEIVKWGAIDMLMNMDEYLSSYAKLGNEYHEEVAKIQGLQQRADNSLKTLLVTLEDTMETVIDPAKEAKVNAASSPQQRSAAVSISFTIGGIIIGILLAFFIIRGITKPINRIIETLREGSDQVASASTQVST